MLSKIATLPESLSIRNSSVTDWAGCSGLLWLGVVSTWSEDNIFVGFLHQVTQVRSSLLDVVSACFDNVLLSLCCCLFFYLRGQSLPRGNLNRTFSRLLNASQLISASCLSF